MNWGIGDSILITVLCYAESRAICRYLSAKYADQGSKLLPDPKDFKAMALADQALSIENADFYPSALAIAIEAIFHP